jgi:hypothetical protein
MKLHTIQDSSNKFIIGLLEETFSKITNSNIIRNYHPDYKNDPANIFYILTDVNGRYKKGSYFVLENNNEFVCSAGYNQYDLDSSIALALTRAYVDPKFRAHYYMGEYILPEIIKNTTQYKHLYITADSYNSAIYQYFVRASQGKTTALYNNWPDIYRKFKPIGKKTIYFTEQYVAEFERE